MNKNTIRELLESAFTAVVHTKDVKQAETCIREVLSALSEDAEKELQDLRRLLSPDDLEVVEHVITRAASDAHDAAVEKAAKIADQYAAGGANKVAVETAARIRALKGKR